LQPMRLEIVLDFILIRGVEVNRYSTQQRYLLWHQH